MPNIKQITLPSGTTYDLVDQGARDLIADIQSYTSYLGVTSTSITDGSTTNPITVNGKSVTAKTGDIVNYGSKEFIWNGSVWQEFGDMSGLGALAYKDSASGSYKPEGTVSQPTFTGKSMTSTGKFTPSGSVNVATDTTKTVTAYANGVTEATGASQYTPSGSINITPSQIKSEPLEIIIEHSSDPQPVYVGGTTYAPSGIVSIPRITVTPSTANFSGIDSVGTLPSFSATVENEVLSLSWDSGTLPTKASQQTVVTGIESATSTQPVFTGTTVNFKTEDLTTVTKYTGTFTGTPTYLKVEIPVPDTFSATFAGTEGDVSVTGTTDGTVSKPTFTGTSKTVTVS